MARGDAQLGMVEGSAFEAHAVVGQGFHEGYQRGTIARAQIERAQSPADVRPSRKIASARIEIDYLLERGLAAIVEIRSAEFDIAQAGRLESPVHDGSGTLGDRGGKRVAEVVAVG